MIEVTGILVRCPHCGTERFCAYVPKRATPGKRVLRRMLCTGCNRDRLVWRFVGVDQVEGWPSIQVLILEGLLEGWLKPVCSVRGDWVSAIQLVIGTVPDVKKRHDEILSRQDGGIPGLRHMGR